MTMGTHPIYGGLLAGTLLLFNGAPRCVSTANLLLNISHLLDADHLEQDKPRSRVHCEESEPRDAGESGVEPAAHGDCRCVVLAVSVA